MSIQIFKKAIDRHIDGVIKADDDSTLGLELEEYVLTGEAQSRLEDFLEAYNSHSANGAWISGFFGSGKSHLLKMLAIVLEDREINGQPASEIFLRDKCMDIPTLKGLLTKAVSTPSKSILFNIDQKADIISKSQDDAVLSVFLKVFNESCGYYSKYPHIAQMERELDEEELLDKFKQKFQEISGQTWEFGRVRPARFNAAIDQAYQQVTGSDKTGVIDYFNRNFKLSIDDFANMVKDYIDAQDKKHPGFRLNFFVDEVGQYVANSIKLMTNLQTIAESLNTVCKMRSWLVVTSQSNVSDIVGEMTRQSGNDFSKIEGRFSKKIALTGANADEVIRRRLLEKNSDCLPELSKIYAKYADDFKTMFDFADGSKRYKCFADEDAFISCYPFVPYQFDLFQTTMLNLSTKEAFTGKYTAIGERSMLAVCQDAAKKLCMDANADIGSVVPFDYWYEGIRLALKPAQINQIIVGEHNLSDDPFAIRLLKALFLVKYVREFKATARNLSILMIDNLNINIAELRKKVEESLARLERESYLQRVGDNYEYLTDEEKDIDKEIKSLDIPPEDVEKLYQDIIFDSILGTRRINCSSGASYNFIARIDGHDRGRSSGDLALHFITPSNPKCGDLQELKMQCFGRDEVLFALPQDPKLITDIATYKKTDTYLRKNPTNAEPDGQRKRLLEARADTNRSTRISIEDRLKKLISEATVFISGDDSKSTVTEARGRISACFDELATRAYSSRDMISGLSNVTEADIPKFLKKEATIPGLPTTLTEAEQEILGFARMNEQKGIRSTMKTVMENFESKPYGWSLGAIDCLVARLWANGHIDASINSIELNESTLKSALLNSHQHADLVLSLAQQFTPSQIRRVKDFAQDFFNAPIASQDAKAVGEELKNRFTAHAHVLAEVYARRDAYPFVAALSAYAEEFAKGAGRSWTWFFGDEFAKRTDELLDAKDRIMDPICGAFSNGQATIYSEARRFYEEQKVNFPYVMENPAEYNAKGSDEEKLAQLLASPEVYKNAGFKQIKSLKDGLVTRVNDAAARMHTTLEQKVAEQLEQLKATDDFKNASEDARQYVITTCANFIGKTKQESMLPTLSVSLQNFLNVVIPGFYEKLTPPTPSTGSEGVPESGETQPKSVKVIPLQKVKPPIAKTMLETPEDVNAYIDALRQKMLAEIEAGNKLFVN